MERWSPRLAFAAAVLFVGHAVVRGLGAFTAVPPPVDVFGPMGYVAATLALVGLSPSIVDETPVLGRLATAVAAVTGPAWALLVARSVADATGLFTPRAAVLPAVLPAVVILSTLLLYLLFAVACFRAGPGSRRLGLLLFAPVVLLGFLVVGGVVLSTASRAGPVVVGSGLAIAHGAIGWELSTSRPGTDHVRRADGATGE